MKKVNKKQGIGRKVKIIKKGSTSIHINITHHTDCSHYGTQLSLSNNSAILAFGSQQVTVA